MDRSMNGRNNFSILGGVTGIALAAVLSAPAAQAQETRVLPVDLTNIAAAANGGRVVSATTTLTDDPAFNASNLIDGQVYDPTGKTGSAGWASNKFDPVNMDYVTFAFAKDEVKRIGKIAFNNVIALNPERWAKDIEVQVSTDTADGPYTAISQVTLKRVAGKQEFLVLPTNARFVRLMFRSNWGSDRSVGLGEVEIYEAIDSDNGIGGVIARLEGSIRDLQRFKDTDAEIRNSIGSRSAANDKAIKTVALENGVPVTVGGNIAASKNGGKIVDYSSIFSDDPKYSPDNLIDGENYSPADDKGSYGWSSEGFAPSRQYVTIGFRDDRSHVVNKLVLNPVSNQSNMRWATRVDVQVSSGSPKEGPFRTVETFNIRQEPTNQEFTMRPVEAKYVRIVFTANGPGNPLPLADPAVSSDRSVSLGEVEIYEPPADSGTLDALIGRFRAVLDDLKRLRKDNATLAVAPRKSPVASNVIHQLPAAPAAKTIISAKVAAPATVKPAAAAKPKKPAATTAATVKKSVPAPSRLVEDFR